jgi:ABC-type bacteriocin/lantibiotic exporter with double-glycine peptidase domain
LIAFSASLGQVAPQFIRIVVDELILRGELRLFIFMGLGMLLFYIFEVVSHVLQVKEEIQALGHLTHWVNV